MEAEEERGRGKGRREAGKQAGSLGHLIQLLAILLWDHYTALLLSQSACLLPAAYPSVHTGRVFGQYGWKYKIEVKVRMRKLQSSKALKDSFEVLKAPRGKL